MVIQVGLRAESDALDLFDRHDYGVIVPAPEVPE